MRPIRSRDDVPAVFLPHTNVSVCSGQSRGLVNYYQATTWVSVAMSPYRQPINRAACKALKNYSVKWVPANETSTLPSVHLKHKAKIVAMLLRFDAKIVDTEIERLNAAFSLQQPMEKRQE